MSGPLDFEPPVPGERPVDEPPAPRTRSPRTPPPTGPPPPTRPPGASRYGWFIGVIAVLVLAYISVNTLRSHHLDVAGPPAGSIAPPFAVPLALSNLDGDANVARRADSGAAGDRPACRVRGPRILNVCQLGERGPFVLAFFATRGADCTGPLDEMQRLRGRFPDVGFAAVSVRGDRDGLRALIRRHGWKFPVGWDRDGALVNVYGVAVCPEVMFSYPGRVIRDTVIGKGVTAQMERNVRALVAASKRRGWRP